MRWPCARARSGLRPETSRSECGTLAAQRRWIQAIESVLPVGESGRWPQSLLVRVSAVTLWVKICGLTTDEGIAAAVAAGADAVGFVFVPSKRQVTAQRAAELARSVPLHVTRVAVMQHPAQALLDEVWTIFRPDVLQTDAEDLESLIVPAGLAVMPVLRAGRVRSGSLPQRFLFEGPVSGAGEAADWNAAAELARQSQLILAGGLNPANVADAVRRVRPFGVDVSSGVEREPGIKDAAKIAQFVRAARSSTPALLSE